MCSTGLGHQWTTRLHSSNQCILVTMTSRTLFDRYRRNTKWAPKLRVNRLFGVKTHCAVADCTPSAPRPRAAPKKNFTRILQTRNPPALLRFPGFSFLAPSILCTTIKQCRQRTRASTCPANTSPHATWRQLAPTLQAHSQICPCEGPPGRNLSYCRPHLHTHSREPGSVFGLRGRGEGTVLIGPRRPGAPSSSGLASAASLAFSSLAVFARPGRSNSRS